MVLQVLLAIRRITLQSSPSRKESSRARGGRKRRASVIANVSFVVKKATRKRNALSS